MEAVKHVFEVEHMTFVIAANVEELAKAVQGAYGGTFNGSGYLERFFDITLELPAGSRVEFFGSLNGHSGPGNRIWTPRHAGLDYAVTLRNRPLLSL